MVDEMVEQTDEQFLRWAADQVAGQTEVLDINDIKRLLEIADRLEISEQRKNAPEPSHLWLNAFSCVRPTDKFATDVGHSVIGMLKDGAQDSGVWRRTFIEVVAS